MKYTFDRVVRLVIALAVITGLALLVNRLSGVLLPFLVGWLLAYLIHPLVKFVQHTMKVGHRGVSIFISLLFIALVITGLWGDPVFYPLLAPGRLLRYGRRGRRQ